MSINDPEKKEGIVPSAIELFKKLFLEDPLIAIIAIFGMLPLLADIVDNAGKGNGEAVTFNIIVLCGIVVFVIVPLNVLKAWKDREKTLTEQRKEVIQTEGAIRLEGEKNRQRRVNSLAEAKIEAVQAQASLALSMSDRAGRDALAEEVAKLRELMEHKGINFVDPVVCTENVHKLMQEISKINMDYDTILESLNALELAMKVPQTVLPVTPEEVEVKLQMIHPDIQAKIDSLEQLLEQKNGDIAHMIKDIEGGAKNYQELQTEYDRYRNENELQKESESLKIPIEKMSDVHVTQKVDEELDEAPLKEALGILDKMEDKENDGIVDKIKSTIESAKDVAIGIVPTVLKLNKEEDELKEQMEKDIKEVYGVPGEISFAEEESSNEEEDFTHKYMDLPATESESQVSEQASLDDPEVEELAVQQKPSPPVTYWTCPKCKRTNALGKIRCPACGSSKPQ